MDYKDTLNLPNTKFKMKANLPQKEPEIAKVWDSSDIYSKIKEARSAQPKYVLHDGPPYANGHIHIGHALNKTLKDIVIKYKTMRGRFSDYIPGWDCHGLPVEHQLLKELKIKKEEIDQVKFRKKARDYALKFVKIQRKEFERLGIFGDWDNPYLTLDKVYEAGIIRSFAKLVKDGYIYKGLKPVNFCYTCETALAEAEVEYDDHTSPSVYVKFKIKAGSTPQPTTYPPKADPPLAGKPQPNTSILIWTTTPWTLIANVAVAVHPDAEYVVVDTGSGNIILAKQLLEQVKEVAALEGCNIVATIKGSELQGLTYDHPFGLREGKVVTADYVSMEEGTGCVHTAPGHGQDDYLTGLKYKLPIVMPVDEKGNFFGEASDFVGMNVHKANPSIIEKLKKLGLMLHDDKIRHSYPHCWRCKSPIIFRATEQWFVSIDHNDFRIKILSEINNIEWVPPQGQERISTMVANRPDWCLSRQRYWGVPIPVFYCIKCKKWIADEGLIENFAKIVEQKGTDAWFELKVEELLPAGFKCPNEGCDGTEFKKGEDILDVWFESGVSHQGVLKKRDTLSYPADLYLEGSDQHRGWFQSSLITALGVESKSAFKTVLTHGFVVDGEGKKMSKSTGNVIAPQDIIKDFGADILRLWVASSDYNDDVRISDTIITRLTDAYRKIRNTARFILGNLADFNPDTDIVPYEKMLEIDKWAVSRAHSLLKELEDFYERFQFHRVYHAIYRFCIIDMSNFYLDILKDRLYTFKSDSIDRRSCQSAMHEVLKSIVNAIAPILVFTAEEIWQNMPKGKDAPESAHLSLWPQVAELRSDKELEARWQELMNIRDAVLKTLEDKRTSGIIGSSLEAKVLLYAKDNNTFDLLKNYENILCELFITSQAVVSKDGLPEGALKDDKAPGLAIVIERAQGKKCARCWNYSESVGEDTNYSDICHRCKKTVEIMKGDIQDETRTQDKT
ncbi:isoleucine--tRNA ligase [Candidatus Omnitrophota bacterium]